MSWRWRTTPSRIHLFHLLEDDGQQIRIAINHGKPCRWVTLCGKGPFVTTPTCVAKCTHHGSLRPVCQACWHLWAKVLAADLDASREVRR